MFNELAKDDSRHHCQPWQPYGYPSTLEYEKHHLTILLLLFNLLFYPHRQERRRQGWAGVATPPLFKTVW